MRSASQQTDEVLAGWGFSETEIADLREIDVIGTARPTATP